MFSDTKSKLLRLNTSFLTIPILLDQVWTTLVFQLVALTLLWCTQMFRYNVLLFSIGIISSQTIYFESSKCDPLFGSVNTIWVVFWERNRTDIPRLYWKSWKVKKVEGEKWKGQYMRYISLYIFYRIGMYTYVEPKTNFVKFIAELLLSFSYTQTWLDSSIHYNTGLIFAPSSCQQFIPYWQLSLVVRRCPPSVYFCRDIAFL